MPSLRIFGRGWGIASDDFVFPEITEATVRFIWLVVTLAIYVTHAHVDSCRNLHVFMITASVINGFFIMLSVLTAYVSSLGTILNPTARRRLPCLIYFRCPFMLLEFIWNIIGVVWLSQEWSKCDAAFLGGATFIVAGGWCVVLTVVIGICINFDPLGNFHHADYRMTDEMKKLWKRRIRFACFCASRSDKAKLAFEDVAELMTDYFGDTDLVWTDVWAAMLLLANKELRVLNERVRQPVSDEVPTWMNCQMASRIMDFSLGVYGWPYYACGKGCSPRAMCDLWGKLRCCTGCRCDNVIVIKDNCCFCNTASLLLQTGIQETDLFYVNLHNEVWETPFIACFDHSSRAIVISIRGSLSLRDAITDLSVFDDTLQLNTCSSSTNPQQQPDAESSGCVNYRVHKGMLSSARYVLAKLENEKILDDMFVLQPSYDLVITGHSLGAGVAAVVSMVLKPAYPDVKCFAFSPPGCVISDEAIEFTQSFVFSVVVGDDLVSRLSVHSMRRLKDNVLSVLQNYDRPKFEILLKGCFKLLRGARTVGIGAAGGHRYGQIGADASNGAVGVDDPADLLDSACYDDGGIPRAIVIDVHDYEPLISSRQRVPSYTDEQRKGDAAGGGGSVSSGSLVFTQLRCPGRIMHILAAQSSDYGKPRLLSRWISCSQLSEIIMSSSMISDHLPWTVSKVLKDLATQL